MTLLYQAFAKLHRVPRLRVGVSIQGYCFDPFVFVVRFNRGHCQRPTGTGRENGGRKDSAAAQIYSSE